MTGTIALVAPGQGAQKGGMLKPWLRQDSQIASWSARTGLDLQALGTTAPSDALVETRLAQPLLVAAGALALDQVGELPESLVCAGHSVGELTACIAAQVLSADDAVWLAAQRGAAMHRCCDVVDSTMVALVGSVPSDLGATLAPLGLYVANVNSATQVVVAGPRDAAETLQLSPPVGTVAKALAVAGAFHTPLMAQAQDEFAEAAHTVIFRDPSRVLLSNANGQALTTGAEVRDHLIRQIVSPVRWDLCMDALQDRGVTTTVELPPAAVLTSLVGRRFPNVTAKALKSPRDLRHLTPLPLRSAA